MIFLCHFQRFLQESGTRVAQKGYVGSLPVVPVWERNVPRFMETGVFDEDYIAELEAVIAAAPSIEIAKLCTERLQNHVSLAWSNKNT